MLCSYLHPHLVKKVIHFRCPVSVEHRVAVTIWTLTTNIEPKTISVLFGLGWSTVDRIVNETCEAITTYLLKKFVHIPQGQQLQESIEECEYRRGFSQVICPEESGAEYHNHEYPSI